MTWKEFKAAVEAQGVLETDEIADLDYTSFGATKNLIVFRDIYEDGRVEVTIEGDWCRVHDD